MKVSESSQSEALRTGVGAAVHFGRKVREGPMWVFKLMAIYVIRLVEKWEPKRIICGERGVSDTRHHAG